MFPILQIGPLAIQVGALLIIGGVWLAIALAEREAQRLNQSADQISTLAYIGLLGGLLAARLAHVARYFSAYAADPLAIFSPSPAALAVPEGVLISVFLMFWYMHTRKMNWRLTIETFTPAWIILIAAFALAHLATGEAFGAPARLPWSIYLWEEYRHPSQGYELIAALLLGVIWWVRQRIQGGHTFWLVIASWAIAFLFLEYFRGDSLLFNGFRVMQFFYLGVWGICGVILYRQSTVKPHPART